MLLRKFEKITKIVSTHLVNKLKVTKLWNETLWSKVYELWSKLYETNKITFENVNFKVIREYLLFTE